MTKKGKKSIKNTIRLKDIAIEKTKAKDYFKRIK